MKDVRAQAAKSLARVIANGESFTGELDLPSSNHNQSQRNSVADSRLANGDFTHKDFASSDIGFYRELCFGTLRYYHRLDALLRPFLKKPLGKKDADIHALLLIGLYQITIINTPDHAAISATVDAAKSLKKQWAKGLVNAVLRNFLRQQKNDQQHELTDAAQHAHPDWLFEALQKHWPEHWQQLVDYNNSPPPFALRVNLGKVSRDDTRHNLAESEIGCEADEHTPSGLLADKARAVTSLPGFEQGEISVQDLGAQLACELLSPTGEMRILDACAAPGGKTSHVLESAPKSSIYAADSVSERLLKVEENVARIAQTLPKAPNIQYLHADSNDVTSWWDGKPFDRILVDAPCSGTGVISHHPDIKLLRRPSDLATFASQQLQLLNSLWPLLADDGLLLYCTCSVMPQENAEVIDTFLNEQPGAQAQPIEASWGVAHGAGRQLLPNRGKNGGFFYARLSKSATL